MNNITHMQPLVELDGIHHSFGGRTVLDNVNLALREHEITGLLGRSGSGKSTLLRMIAGLVAPASGHVRLRHQTPAVRPGMVFQSFALFPWLTVLGNVEVGLEAMGVPAAERRQRAEAAVRLIGLEGFGHARPRELSGGMRQRVGLARALVVNPDILLMDEPFSALDMLTAEQLRDDLLALWQQRQTPIRSILLVTHNIEEAVAMCDRILLLSSDPGRIIDEIRIDLPRPRHTRDPAFRAMAERVQQRMHAGATPGQPRSASGKMPG